MTREEQIIEASQLYAKHQQKPFMDGALWSDKNPSQDQIDALRMEYEKGRADAISNPTGGELLHVLNKGHKQGYKEATDKVCEFLKDRILHDSIDYPMATLHLIDDLKNYMEELQ